MEKKGERRTWSWEETRAFLCAYLARKDEFDDPHKKKYGFENVLLDLESQGILTKAATVETLSSKLKKLLRAYKESVDTNKRTDAAACIAPFMDLMEEIFGKNPIISNDHTLNLYGSPIKGISGAIHGADINDATHGAENVCDPEESSPCSSRPTKRKNSKAQEKQKRHEEKMNAFAVYKKQKLEKLEQQQIRKDERHAGKMPILREIADTLKSGK